MSHLLDYLYLDLNDEQFKPINNNNNKNKAKHFN